MDALHLLNNLVESGETVDSPDEAHEVEIGRKILELCRKHWQETEAANGDSGYVSDIADLANELITMHLVPEPKRSPEPKSSYAPQTPEAEQEVKDYYTRHDQAGIPTGD